MDTVSTIIAALTAGSIAIASGTATAAGKDAYDHLKSLMRRHTSDSPDAEFALRKFEEAPEAYALALKRELAVVRIEEDAELLEAAMQVERVLQQAGDARALAMGRSVAIAGNASNVNIVTGDNSHVGRLKQESDTSESN